METEYYVKFPSQEINFDENQLTVSIEYMKSRGPSSVYFILHFYDIDGNEKHYTSPRWVVDNTYSTYHHTFDVSDELLSFTHSYQLELRLINITSENPLYLTGIMLNTGEYEGYHTPNEVIREKVIKFNKSRYTNLYNDEGNYLQVIRPYGDDISTIMLNKSRCTVLAPHLFDESDVDNPINLFLEYLNQTEQRIDVLR